MKIILRVIIISALIVSCSSPENQTSTKSPLETAVDEIVKDDLDSGRIAGLAIGVTRHDSTLLLKSYGYADLEFDVALPIEASFEIGSITKQFTAVAIMQLVGKSMLSLDDPITDYLEFDTKGRTITIYQLLNHTSGIKGYTEMPEFGDLVTKDLPRDTLLRMVEQVPFDFEPGEAMIYNNTAYFMLGLIIEKVTGETYQEYLEENVFEPAGLENTYYCDERAVRKLRAHGYDMNAEGNLDRASYLDHLWPYAAGSICSTVGDLLKWLNVLHKTDLVLSRDLYQQLIAPAKLNNGTVLRYAMGLSLNDFNGHRMIGHGGGIFGFLSDSRYFPEEDLATVTLINTAGPVSPAGISNAVAEKLLSAGEISSVPFEGDITNLAGIYSGPARGRELTVTIEASENSLLLKRETNSDTLSYKGDNTWFKGNTFYRFVSEDGGISQLEVDAGGGYYILRRQQ